ncbi:MULTISPECIES: DUF3426 domain-containing protein [unclassified Acidovorax]|uniref:DUF3426 domain-containing protein n=1 Tax=unclassified Acidovorax TaxID=2684926 RepID=UPI002882E2B1|nr:MULTISPECIES: DUF3426 domain-containing protein [unclassified Acidovorax]
MSQITRCPACATTFKVVADQLRISDGWVRCGQCKEVFHAASNLQVAPSEPLLPDLPFDQWGTAEDAGGQESVSLSTPRAAAAQVWGSARSAVAGSPPVPPGDMPLVAPLSSLAEATPAAQSPVVPLSVPAFLSANRQAGGDHVPPWDLEPATRFGWRIREPAVVAPALPLLPAHSDVAAAAGEAAGAPEQSLDTAGSDSGGYELPFAELRDSGWPEDLEDDGGSRPVADSSVEDGPVAQVVESVEAPWAADPLDAMVGLEAQAIADAGPVMPIGPAPFTGTGLLRKADAGISTEETSSPVAVVPPKRSTELSGRAVALAKDRPVEDESAAEQEPGFIRVARRQAFWRRPAVRVALAAGALLLLAFLALQVALRDRDRIASLHPFTRPALQAVCSALGCSLAPPRSISDVVIDSSSFTKGRVDSTFQLQLALKNRGAMMVAMPAVELTLTDAQDQAVVRRVIRAEELGAPSTLTALGEWAGGVSLAVNADAGRITGYRVLAFYP